VARTRREALLFAYLAAAVALLRLFGAGMALAQVAAPPGSKQAQAASIVFALDASVIIVAGVASYAVFRAMADAARAILAMAGALVMLHEEE
jgi:hypothetical protein